MPVIPISIPSSCLYPYWDPCLFLYRYLYLHLYPYLYLRPYPYPYRINSHVCICIFIYIYGIGQKSVYIYICMYLSLFICIYICAFASASMYAPRPHQQEVVHRHEYVYKCVHACMSSYLFAHAHVPIDLSIRISTPFLNRISVRTFIEHI